MYLVLPPNCCCGPIGFDEAAWSWVTQALDGVPVRTFLKNDISQIEGCIIVFAGNNGQCGNAVRFNEADWPTIKDWIHSGGKFFICGEHSGNYKGPGLENGMLAKCLQDIEQFNTFLFAMQSAIQYIGNDYNARQPPCRSDYYSPGLPSLFAQGIYFPGERFGELTGATPLWVGPSGSGGTGNGLGKIAARIEKLGQGILIATGDGNHGRCAGYEQFLRFLYDKEVNEIL